MLSTDACQKADKTANVASISTDLSEVLKAAPTWKGGSKNKQTQVCFPNVIIKYVTISYMLGTFFFFFRILHSSSSFP